MELTAVKWTRGWTIVSRSSGDRVAHALWYDTELEARCDMPYVQILCKWEAAKAVDQLLEYLK